MFTVWSPAVSKDVIVNEISQVLANQKLTIVEKNITKPWGAYWRINDNDLAAFVKTYFPNDPIEVNNNLSQSPKILLVAPNARLSWQYHHRRAEIWKVVVGPVKAIHSLTDQQGPPEIFPTESLITLQQTERHRLIGAENWGVVAEIWQHTDPVLPSDEEDNIRLDDDYGRQGTNTR